MAEQRLIDANNLGVGKANPDAFERKDYAYGWNSALQAVTEASPTIDPESLPIVRQLREELARVTAERDAAVKQLSEVEDCDTCKNAKCAMRGGTGKCEWKWRGPQKEE